MGSLYRSQHELICVFKSGTGRHINNIELGKNGRHRTNVWEYDSASTQARQGNNVLELHPTVKGYQVWADGLKPILTELLGPPAKTNHAPAPTGDPSAGKAPAGPTSGPGPEMAAK